MPKNKRTLLIYTVGQSDVQILRKEDGHWVHRPFDKKQIGAVCRKLEAECQRNNPNIHSLQKLKAREEGYLTGEWKGVVEEAFISNSGVHLCFPLFERLLILSRRLQRVPEHVVLINTNRQGLAVQAQADDRDSRFRNDEPYLYHKLMAWYGHCLLQGKATFEELLIGENRHIDAWVASQEVDDWLVRLVDQCRERNIEHVQICATAGMSDITTAIRSLVPIHLRAAGISFEFLAISDRIGDKPIPHNLHPEDFFWRRAEIVAALSAKNFSFAHDRISRSAFRFIPSLEEQAQLISSCIEGNETAAKALAAEVKRIGLVPAWYRDYEDSTPVERYLTRGLHAYSQENASVAAVFIAAAVELACRECVKSIAQDGVRRLPDKSGRRGSEVLYLENVTNDCASALRKAKKLPDDSKWVYLDGRTYEEVGKYYSPSMTQVLAESESLRAARNVFIHDAQQVRSETVKAYLGYSSAFSVQEVNQSNRLGELVKLSGKASGSITYWPTLAAKELVDAVRQIDLEFMSDFLKTRSA
jgi:hypothetical protein